MLSFQIPIIAFGYRSKVIVPSKERVANSQTSIPKLANMTEKEYIMCCLEYKE